MKEPRSAGPRGQLSLKSKEPQVTCKTFKVSDLCNLLDDNEGNCEWKKKTWRGKLSMLLNMCWL